MSTLAPFTISDAHAVRILLECVTTNARVQWVPNGDTTYTGTSFCRGVARAITSNAEGSGFLSRDADIRDGYLWISDVFESFIPVKDILEWIKGELFMRTPK